MLQAAAAGGLSLQSLHKYSAHAVLFSKHGLNPRAGRDKSHQGGFLLLHVNISLLFDRSRPVRLQLIHSTSDRRAAHDRLWIRPDI